MKYAKSGNPYRERGVFHGKGYQPARCGGRPESGGPFEQAIFLVRDPAFPRGDAVREACRIAEGCLGSRRRRPRRVSARLLPAAFALGALTASLVHLLASLF